MGVRGEGGVGQRMGGSEGGRGGMVGVRVGWSDGWTVGGKEYWGKEKVEVTVGVIRSIGTEKGRERETY